MIMEWSRWRKEVTSAFIQSGYPIGGVVVATIVNVLFLTYMGSTHLVPMVGGYTWAREP
ncbi:hypothetical protein [Vulcanisaeta distributa]|uniref:hypothetical protein n=1 Tax=Vulcanisaeta distributa TaxID=164451 RepID=UPI001FB37E86|nr:hypothetical protein [Vulcanisaeta distributa]